jgi:hypothetical protein
MIGHFVHDQNHAARMAGRIVKSRLYLHGEFDS